MRIGHIELEKRRKCLVIGEVGLAHEGSLGMAHSFIDAIASAGGDAVKFQTHFAEAEGTVREQFRVNVFPQDATRSDYWRRTAFTEDQWRGLKNHAEEKGLLFLSSPFSILAFEMLDRLGIEAWKVSSGDISNYPLLDKMCLSGKPLMISTGMSPWAEIDSCVDFLRTKKTEFLIFQCNNTYPCPPEALGLNVISELEERYTVPVGLSDHSARSCSGIAAFSLGAVALEVHVTLSPYAFGPDVKASLDINTFSDLCSSIRFLEKSFSSPVNKDEQAEKMDLMRKLFMKGIVATDSLEKGRVLKLSDMAFKKPLEGIPASNAFSIIGRILSRAKEKDNPIFWEDLENE